MPYLAEMKDEFLPFNDPGNFDALRYLETVVTMSGGDMPGNCFLHVELYVDKDHVPEVLKAFAEMARRLKAACEDLGLA